MFARELKSRLKRGELTLGPLMSFDYWPGYIEIMKAEGMDYAVCDLEHGAYSFPVIEEVCRTARLCDFPVLIRPESCTYPLIRKCMDLGPAGLMIPWVETVEQIETLRRAAFLPPLGQRGPGGPSILANRSLDRAGWDEVEKTLFMLIQIESPKGVENLPALAGHDWIDAVMLGPYDLSVNLGHCGQIEHPDVVAAIERVRDGAEKLGKPCGMVVGGAEQARFWMDRGFTFLITGEISFMVRQHMRQLVKTVRGES